MYIEDLRSALDALVAEEEELRRRIQPLFAEWRHKQEQIAALKRALELLQTEPDSSSYQLHESQGSNSMKPVDIAYRTLVEAGEPLHYERLLSLMEATGFSMPGTNPGANLLAHVGRDQRFIRVGSGMYGLAEWHLRAAPKRGRRKTRRRTSRRTP